MTNGISRMKKLVRKFNKVAPTLEAAKRIAARASINIKFYEMREDVRGYYQTERKNVYRKKYICINKNLSEKEILEVILHELVHHFLHVSMALKKQTFFSRIARLNDSKNDLEADTLSLVWEIPQARLLELYETNFEDISEYSHEKLIRRWKIYQEYGE